MLGFSFYKDLYDDQKTVRIDLDRKPFFNRNDEEFREFEDEFNRWVKKIWEEFLVQVKDAKQSFEIYHKLSNKLFKDRLRKALKFIAEKHVYEGNCQLRSCGNYFINHPMRQCFAAIGESQGLKTYFPRLKVRDIVISTVLHDVVEDTDSVTIGIIKKEFGDTVASNVDVVTKTSKKATSEERILENMKALFTKSSKNPGGIITKMYDVRDNIRTVFYVDRKIRMVKVIYEAIRFYVPVCEVIGALGFKHFREIKYIVLNFCRDLIKDKEFLNSDLTPDNREMVNNLIDRYKKYNSTYTVDRYIKVGDNSAEKFLSNFMKQAGEAGSLEEMEEIFFNIISSLTVQAEQDTWKKCQAVEKKTPLHDRLFKCYDLVN